MSMKKRPFIILIQVAFLSIFIISAVPIPSAEAGWSDLVKKELFKQPRTLRGVVFLDNDISNATVSIYDLWGFLLHSEQNATAEDGSFMITCPLPESFKIVVTGGSLGGELFSDEVVRIIPHFYEWDKYKVNAITTLMAKYQDRHPEMSYNEVTEAVENFLSLPDDVDISDVIYSSEWFSYHFSHYLFMKEAEDNGGLSQFIDQILDELDGGNSLRSFSDSESAKSSLFQDLLNGLIEGAKGKAVEVGTGWILGLLGLGEPDTDARLNEMSDKLDEVLSDLQNIISALNDLSKQLALDTNKVKQYIEGMSAKDAISTIKTHYDQEGIYSLKGFASLRSEDVDDNVKKHLQTFANNIGGDWDIQNQVTKIHDAIVSEIGGTEGLLELWTGEFILRSPVSDDQLKNYYKTLENYFSVLLFYQFKGANLVVEAMNFQGQSQGSGDSPATRYLKRTFQPMIKAETDMFLNCVVKLILYNSGLFSQIAFLPGAAQDILARATFFITQTLNEDHYGLRAGILGTANLFPAVSHGVALDTHLHGYIAGVGERVDIDLKSEGTNLPDKAYDSWTSDLKTLERGTVYTLKKYDFVPSDASGIFKTGLYGVGDDSINTACSATVRRYTKDYHEDPNGEIVYGYCVAAARMGGREATMERAVFHKNQWTVSGSARPSEHGEEDRLDFPGVLFLRAWLNAEFNSMNVKLEYSRDFTFIGPQTTAYLNISGKAHRSGIRYSHAHGSEHAEVNIGIVNVTQGKIIAQFSPYLVGGEQVLAYQLSFQLEPGNRYYVFANVVGSGYGGYCYDVDMTLTHLSLTFVNKER